MLSNLRKVAVVTGITMALGLSLPAHANLINNGSFESGNKDTATTGVCSDSVTGWSVSALGSCGGIDWIQNSGWAAQDGNFSIDLNSFNTGAISQTFDTTSGSQYLVSFYLAGNPGHPSIVKNLDVLINNVDLVSGAPDFSFDGTGKTTTNMGWTLQSFTFTANSALTTLTFKSLMTGAEGPALDNVVVTAVPEPETYAMMLAGLGLLGFAARRKKNC